MNKILLAKPTRNTTKNIKNSTKRNWPHIAVDMSGGLVNEEEEGISANIFQQIIIIKKITSPFDRNIMNHFLLNVKNCKWSNNKACFV